jgi:hypothetical protein
MGEVEVKNIARPLRVYKVVLDGTADRPLLGGPLGMLV